MKMNDIQKYSQDVLPETLQIIRDLCRIPAPSHHEEQRADYCRNWFEKNGFENVFIDEALNVIAPLNDQQSNDLVVIMAHTDTVFPDMEPLPLSEDDEFIYSPGVTDDTANLAVLMVCSRYYREHRPDNAPGMIIVANSCEEGLGNLKGSRAIMQRYGSRVREFISLDSSSLHRLTTGAVGSHRYKVTVKTEGGHSFGDFGNRNAIAVLANMITMLYSVKVPQNGSSQTTYNVGGITGGTSVNTIAQQAEMLYEYRSNDRICLEKMRDMFETLVATIQASGVAVDVEILGERPCSGEIDRQRFEALKNRWKAAAGQAQDLPLQERFASTDCNVPLSMGVPAICFGVCRGSGAHTREEKLEKASLVPGCQILLDLLYRL